MVLLHNDSVFAAIKAKNIPAIKILLEKGANIYIPNNNSETPLSLASNDKEISALFPKTVMMTSSFITITRKSRLQNPSKT